MTGYLYQCELALLELAERSWQDPAAELRMEVLDDIEFLHDAGATPAELLQSKHRIEAGSLSETSKDVWRSIASWIDALEKLGKPVTESMPLLRLVTTQVAAEGSFPYLLRNTPQRDTGLALARMEEVAADADGPSGTAGDRTKFLGLTPARRLRLVEAMVVCDGAPVMSDLDPKLARALGIRPTNEHADAILDQIKGWWYRVAVQLLERKDPNRMRTSVSAQELATRIEEIKDHYTGLNLPITEELRRLTEAEIAAYADRLVVAQMRWIGLKDRTISTHLRDYHHARTQRSEWLRTFKITEAELDQYDRRLWNEWDHVFADLTDAVDDDTSDVEAQSIGKDVLKETMRVAADMPARRGSATESWIGRGTMHSLADRADTDADPVGWHPRFDELCRSHACDDEQEQ